MGEALNPIRTLRFITKHPLNRGREMQAIGRFIAWQIGSRLVREHTHNWIDGAKLAITGGMTGATGNIYSGLHEYADMAFVMHALRQGDTFLDIGANVGSYTVLASGVCGARTHAFEPDPWAADRLERNVALNGIGKLVNFHRCALGAKNGTLAFTVGWGASNRAASIAGINEDEAQTVSLRQLDDFDTAPDVVKMDVEGFESQVVAGGARTFGSSRLLAVLTESNESEVAEPLINAGFARRYYDPERRHLSASPVDGIQAANPLYVRNEEILIRRLASAPTRSVLGKII